MMMASSLLTTGVGGGGVGRMLGVSGGNGATLPSSSVQRDWMASILLGGASWIPAMAVVSLVVASMILSVAVIFRTGMARYLKRNMSGILSPPMLAMRTQMHR